MADEIRCPMCGKMNPASRETCQFCKARLSPLSVLPFDELPEDEEDLTPIDGGDLPDWLKDLRPPGAEPEAPEEESTWDAPAGSFGETPAEEPGEAEAESSSVPDWLERIRRRTEDTPAQPESQPEEPQEEPQEEAQPEAQDEARELPDWLGAGALEDSPFKPSPGEEERTPSEPLAAEPAGPESEPEWLRRFHEKQQNQPPAEAPEAPETSPASEEPEPPPAEEPARPKGMTGWLTAFDKERPSRTTFRRAPESSQEGAEEPQPEWPAEPGMEDRATLPEHLEEPAEEENAAPFEAPDLSALPDWLAGIAPEESPAAPPPSEAAEPPASIEEAPLPSWLEAMRPVEAFVPDKPTSTPQTTEQVEASGPLAGLRGVLPIESDAATPHKGRAYSLKLTIPENQQAHIALLEDLLATESSSRPVAQPKAISSQFLLRLVVALVLLAVVFGSLWLGGGLTPPPGQNRQSAEITNTSFLVGTLPENAPVLVAFDFEPGFSSEMEFTAARVLQQLVDRKVSLAVVSTSPTGPSLAETFLNKAGSAAEAHTNLGFIPGGTLGLVGLVENLNRVFPYDLAGRSVWASGPLAGISSPADFRLVIVLTESPSTARSWIEQVQPSLAEKNVPLLMLLSAQAEPMVRPYFEGSQQVSGIIAGQAGGATYATLLGTTDQPGEAGPGAWDALSAGLLVAAIFILAGSLVNAALLQLAPQKRAEGEK